jgi:hypothetical protein
LTVLSDKLLALSGIALEMRRLLKNDIYLAGLWKATLLEELLWEAKGPNSFRPDATMRIPSWSWASVEGSISYEECLGLAWEEISIPMAEVLNVQVDGPGVIYGDITSGYIEIKGKLFISLGSHPEKPGGGIARATHLHPWSERDSVCRTIPDPGTEDSRIAITFDDKKNMPALPGWLYPLTLYAYDETTRNVRSWPTTLGLVLGLDSEGRFHRLGRFELSGFFEADVQVGRLINTFPEHSITIW